MFKLLHIPTGKFCEAYSVISGKSYSIMTKKEVEYIMSMRLVKHELDSTVLLFLNLSYGDAVKKHELEVKRYRYE